jgi:hypothetical protein
MDVKSTTEEKVPITLAPKTSTGKDAELDGKPTWEVVSGNATIEEDPAGDGLSVFVVSEDTAGTTVIKVSADADLGEGVRTIEEIINYTYSNPEAAALGVVAGTPVPKTSSTPSL